MLLNFHRPYVILPMQSVPPREALFATTSASGTSLRDGYPSVRARIVYETRWGAHIGSLCLHPLLTLAPEHEQNLKGVLSSAPLLAGLPEGTRCTSVCRVFVFHVPLTPPPGKTSPLPSSDTTSTPSHPWQTISPPVACPQSQSQRGQAFFLTKEGQDSPNSCSD